MPEVSKAYLYWLVAIKDVSTESMGVSEMVWTALLFVLAKVYALTMNSKIATMRYYNNMIIIMYVK